MMFAAGLVASNGHIKMKRRILRLPPQKQEWKKNMSIELDVKGHYYVFCFSAQLGCWKIESGILTVCFCLFDASTNSN